jgi:prepilin-type N-terminal cleavage/methylation domain-containing protein
MNYKRTQGFTLIEIAIVLVIIGLLLGGVLKGQELITSARVRNMISVQDGIKAAFFGFQDRFRALPGDYAQASAVANIRGVTFGGNGDGQILNTAGANEQTIAWNHLASAGFLNGSYTMATATEAVADTNTPKNPYSIYLQLVYDNNYADPGTAVAKHNLKTGNQVPVEIMAEVDRKIDDGNAVQGGFRFSRYTPASATGLPAPAAYAAGVCASATGQWYVVNSETNCGGASLF